MTWHPTGREFDGEVHIVGCGVEVMWADDVGGFDMPFDEERVGRLIWWKVRKWERREL
jgi:hypothetical protein